MLQKFSPLLLPLLYRVTAILGSRPRTDPDMADGGIGQDRSADPLDGDGGIRKDPRYGKGQYVVSHGCF